MSECIVITSGKGGVGKTTVTANLGMALAMDGHKVVVVDADLGLRNLDVILGLETRIAYDLVQVIEGQCPIQEALIKDTRVDGLYLLPAAQTSDKNAITPHDMRELVYELRNIFDYVLIDCPAGIEQGFQNAIAGASKAIVVSTPEVSAIKDADRIIGLIEAAELPEPQLILNRYRCDLVERGDMLDSDDVLEILAIPLLGILPDTEDIIISSNRGTPIVCNPESLIGEGFRRVAKRVQGEQGIPFINLHSQHSIWDTLKRWVGIKNKEAM